jgi:hypothetical protein
VTPHERATAPWQQGLLSLVLGVILIAALGGVLVYVAIEVALFVIHGVTEGEGRP